MFNSVAILIFAQTASKEAEEKILFENNRNGNLQAISSLNSFTKQKVHSLQIPVFHSSEFNISNQLTFGEKLTTAISSVFEQGFEKVICIGNDCPALSRKQILEAAECLTHQDAVLGPDYRGGTYLIGLKKDTFDIGLFKDLAWNSGGMLESYLSSFANINIVVLDFLQDINTFEDLQTYSGAKYFIRHLLSFLEESIGFRIPNFRFSIISHNYTILHFRGPPRSSISSF